MCKDEDNNSASESSRGFNEGEGQTVSTPNRKAVENDAARRAEHTCLSTLSSHALNTRSLEVTRPTVTNCPDGGHDIGVTGNTEEVKELVSTLTGKSSEDLSFLNESHKNGKLKVRIDVKNGKTISGDTIDKHAADSNRSPDCQVNLLVLTNPDVKITPEARKILKNQQYLFREKGTLVDIALPAGLHRVEDNNKALAENSGSEVEQ